MTYTKFYFRMAIVVVGLFASAMLLLLAVFWATHVALGGSRFESPVATFAVLVVIVLWGVGVLKCIMRLNRWALQLEGWDQ